MNLEKITTYKNIHEGNGIAFETSFTNEGKEFFILPEYYEIFETEIGRLVIKTR